MPEQCYLIDGRLKFYFVPEDLHIEYKGQRVDLTTQEAKVLKYMFEHNNEGTIAVDNILNANWPNSPDKKPLMQLLFEFGKKCKSIGFVEDGFMLNGSDYLITFHHQLIDGYKHQLEQIKAQKLVVRRYVFIAIAIIIGLTTLT